MQFVWLVPMMDDTDSSDAGESVKIDEALEKLTA